MPIVTSQRVLSRTLILAAGLAVTSLFAFSRALAQDAAPGVPVATSSADIETSKYAFDGEVNADAALRSGPSENDYQVMKLAKGQRLTVVGMRFDWLKVVPPEGSFCLVSEAFIDQAGNGTTGRVINKGAVVRIGSTLTEQKHKILEKQLQPGDTVKIIGATETNEFYKIVPPKDVFMYIDKRFVNPVKRNEQIAAPGTLLVNGTSPAKPLSMTPGGDSATAKADASKAGDNLASATLADGSATTTIQPVPGTPAATPDGATPKPEATPDGKFVVTSDPAPSSLGAVENAEKNVTVVRALQEKLSKLEDRYADAGKQDVGAQPLADLSKDYATLLADKELPPNARKVAEYRASQIKLRQDALAEIASAKKAQEDAAQRARDQKAEQEELAARVAATQVKHFAAVGRLLQSSLQIGNQTLYRLVDPANSRLIIYVRTGNAAIGTGVDKFIAINGKVVQDETMNLTYIQPEGFEVVDPKQLNTKIFAEYSPPSMATANLTGEASAR